jgi:hypothetical protein
MAIIWVGTGRFNAYIGPVQDYIDRVVAADVAAGNTLGLEVGVRDAYDVFIRDSINVGDLGTSGGVLSQANSIIKAAPIMAGARTLAGALVPLVGAAPTNFNFVSEDYNRKTGLVGNGSTKYLNSNRADNADPQDNYHLSFYATSFAASTAYLMGAGQFSSGANNLGYETPGSSTFFRSRNNNTSNVIGTPASGLTGASRSSSSTFIGRTGGTSTTYSRVSQTPTGLNVGVFGSDTAASARSASRLAFYSIGESLDLALLDARVTGLINTFGAVIP